MVKLWNMLQQLPSLFDSISLPEGLDHDMMVNSILFEAAELPPIYTDPALLKQMIDHYFSSRYSIHSQLVSVLSSEYDPIENYNRYEERTGSGTNTLTKSNRENVTNGGTVTSNTNGSTSGEIENKVSAFNATSYQPDDHTDSLTTNNTQAETETSGESETVGSGTENGQHTERETAHIHGNIGVTTSQQMIESSLSLLGVSDVYRYITSDFVRTFCIRCF